MKRKNDFLDELFSLWENDIVEYKGKFVRDGIINEDLFENTSPKILFIMKEPNNPNKLEGDFRKWWKEDIYGTFSMRIAEWSAGILNDFPTYKDIKGRLAQNWLQKIAFINVKKSGGTGLSEYEMISTHIQMNLNYIHKQINIIAPEIIVIGLTWPDLKKTLFPDATWQMSGYDIEIGKYESMKLIDFYHPSSRNAPAASYSLLQNIVRSTEFKDLTRN